MSSLAMSFDEPQQAFAFPRALTEQYRPKFLGDFIGLERQRTILANYAKTPFPTAFLFTGASGTGKTTMALALADAIPAELHHIPSQEANLTNIERVRMTCQYVPMAGFKMHLVLIDEADQMTPAAQVSLLSKLDATNFPPATVFVFTSNSTDRLAVRCWSSQRMDWHEKRPSCWSESGFRRRARLLRRRIAHGLSKNRPTMFARL